MAYVFRGGIMFKDGKSEGGEDDLRRFSPEALTLHADGEPFVRVGDRVFRGQPIAEGVHSPVSGTVADIAGAPGGGTVTVGSDGENTLFPGLSKMHKKLAECSPDEIIEKIRDAGIVGMGGETGSVADRLADVTGRADVCIISCAEREPYVTCDLAALLARPAAVVNGLKIFLRALGVHRGVIAVPEGSAEAIKKLSELTKNSSMITLLKTSRKYPAGDPRRLVYSYTGRELEPDADTAALGCVIFNVQTCIAVYDAFVTGLPSVSRVVTVGGDCFTRIYNFEVPVGTRIDELIRAAGDTCAEPALILNGGPLRGVICNTDGIVEKTTRAILLFSRNTVGDGNTDISPVCIRCGRCVEYCPERLMPNRIYEYIRDGKDEDAVSAGALRCVGCGICSYICPGKAPVTELIAELHRRHADGKESETENEKKPEVTGSDND